MASLLQEIADHFHRDGPVVRVTVIAAQGSTPRERGAAMIVSSREFSGTIGGGALEYDAISHARTRLEKTPDKMWVRDVKDYPLGPQLGQCCGGHVRLLFERYGVEEIAIVTAMIDSGAQYVTRRTNSGTPLLASAHSIGANEIPNTASAQFQYLDDVCGAGPKHELLMSDEGEWFLETVNDIRIPIFLYGAGHVGREVVRIFEGLAVDITWIDTDENRFPDLLPSHVRRLIAVTPQETVAYAPDNAFHIVMSYAHPIDLEICHAVLKRGKFRYLGLIGSKTKRERFLKRLRELGVTEADLARLTCPIGVGGPSGKEPSVIAISLVAEILRLAEGPQDDQVNGQGTD